MKTVPIVEIFPTIQGEGPGLGLPSLFIRLGGCNLRCQFKGEACDTPYAVFSPEALTKKNPALKYGYDKWYPHTVEALVALIKLQPIKHLVFSGGEPTMYQDFILEIIASLNDKLGKPSCGTGAYTAEIETNGTIYIKPGLREDEDFTFNISAKLASSNQEVGYDGKRINYEALNSFPKDRSVYKFVITDPDNDLKEIKEIISKISLPVYVMPQGMTRQEIIDNSDAVVDLAIKNNFRFSPREHIIIWDIKKGK